MSNVIAALWRTGKVLTSQASGSHCRFVKLQSHGIRNLYSRQTLGIDSYLEQKSRTTNQLENIAPRFRDKMREYTAADSTNMVFTEDLKNMLHLADNDEDIELVVKMMKKFNQQNKQLRFGNYVFGPVVMRMFYILDKPDEALACFKSPELNGFFDQLITYQILLDLLYENQKYDEILECFKIIKDQQIEGIKFAKNVVVLTLAACYKLNSKESFDFALNLWKELLAIGHLPMRRAITFFAALALNQDKPEVALEILSSAKNLNYTTIRNLRVSALTKLGRLEEAASSLKSVINEDSAGLGQLHTYNKEIIKELKEVVQKSGSTELKVEFDRIEKYLQQQGQICETPLEEQLCQDIVTPPYTRRMFDNAISRQPRFSRFQRHTNSDEDNSNRREVPRRYRPGLVDLN